MSETALFSRRFPGGAFVIDDVCEHPGSIFFVSSTRGSDTNSGHTRSKPLATLDAAIAKCTASYGDTIYLLPGHAESEATAADLATLDVAGIRIIGLGSGSLIPTFTLGHASATITVSAANVYIRNVKVISDVADCLVGLTVAATADGLTLEDCWFTDGALAKELVVAVSIATTCTDVTIRGCRFETDTSAETGGCASGIKTIGSATRLRILGCYFHGHYTAAPVDLDAAAVDHIIVADNSIFQIDTDAGLAISCHASCAGHVVRNLITNLKDTVAGVVAAGCHVAENYGSNAAGASGLIKPAVDS